MARATALALLASLAALALAAPPAAPAAGGRIAGKVTSGKAPLRGFRVKLLQARPADQRPRLLGVATTSGSGRFSIRYRGAARGAVHYLIAKRPGRRGRVPASAYKLATSLGAGPVPRRARVNERTTVAMAFAMAQFLEGERVSGRNPGLKNAAAMSANLANPTSGGLARVLRNHPNGASTSTLATFNSLANLLASCRPRGRACAQLLSRARVPGERRAADTLRALDSIATYPWHGVGGLHQLSRRAPKRYRPFLGTGQRPSGWTLALRFAGQPGTVDGPGQIAVDAGGDLWVTNAFEHSPDPNAPVCGSEALLRFTPTGRAHPGSPYRGGGLDGAGYGIGFDPRGRLWVGNFGFAGRGCADAPLGNSVSLFDENGNPLSPPLTEGPPGSGAFTGGFEFGGVQRPQGTVADLDGNVWVANCGGNTVSRYANGLTTRAVNLGPNGLARPFGVAVGVRGNVFVTANGNDRVATLDPAGPRTNLAAGPGLDRPLGVATDRRGFAWVANSQKVVPPCYDSEVRFEEGPDRGTMTLLGPEGRQLGSFAGAGLWTPWGVAVDGDDKVWVANFGGQRLSNLCGVSVRRCPAGKRRTGASISPAGSGYGFDGLARNTGIAIDPSGNVWLTNGWSRDAFLANPGGGEIVAFIGLATPVRTPLVGPPERP